ncbi:MAG: DUF4384 domain-containing protein [Treponema sp.]|jgi:TolB-like protein|nr:DUF4384 domain-containing protein [Treponema sp.]
MKKMVFLATLCLIGLAFSTCATSSPGAENSAVSNSITFDQAIADIATYFMGRLPAASHVAITGFEADTEKLSAYMVEELWNHFDTSGTFVMVDRQNLEKIQAEMNYQMSGEVSDESARSIGQQFGVQTIIYGRITRIGNEYRISAYATDVEKARSTIRTLTVRKDERLTALLSEEPESLETKIDKAVNGLGQNITTHITIGIGRISLNGTGTVTSLSDYLKRSITYSASQQQNKYEVAADSVSNEYAVSPANLARDIFVEMDTPQAAHKPVSSSSVLIQGVVEGDFAPLGQDTQVTLRLVSAVDNRILGSSRFVIPLEELHKRGLSLYPPKDDVLITPAEFDEKQSAIDSYNSKNNAFGFTVVADDLDGIYYGGEYMTLRVYAERDCYFKITHINVKGDVQTLYPRSAKDNNFIRAGETRRIPDNTRYRITAPFGEEYILAAAYSSRFAADSSPAVPLSSSSLSRNIMVEDEETHTGMRPFATAKFSYTAMPQ